MVESNDESSIVLKRSKEEGEGGWAGAPLLEERHICLYLCSFLPSRQLLHGHFMNESEMAQKTTEIAIQTPVLMKLDPIGGYFCILDHNLILNSY